MKDKVKINGAASSIRMFCIGQNDEDKNRRGEREK
jgi:hypothetical protein